MTLDVSIIKDLENTATSKLTENTALFNGVLAIISSIGAFLLARWLPSAGLLSISLLLFVTSVTCFIAWMHARIERYAAEEIVSAKDLEKNKSDIFDSDNLLSGDKVRTWIQFEKWFVPAFTILLLLLEVASAFILYKKLSVVAKSPLESPNFHVGIILAMGVFAFIFFLSGKYSAGLAFKASRRQLRAPAGLCVFCAIYSVMIIVSFTVSYFAISNEISTWRNPDIFILWVGVIFFTIFALQHAIELVMAYYKPRTHDSETLPLYENRISSLFASQEGLWNGIADMIDYQFGFKVSETGFYNFVLKALLPLIIFQLVILALVSSIVVVPTGKRAFCERWGKRAGTVLTPGLHYKLPWPVEQVYYTHAKQVISFQVGAYAEREREKGETSSQLWSDLSLDSPLFITFSSPGGKTETATGSSSGHYRSAVNLISARSSVLYSVVDPVSYFYGQADTDSIIKKLAMQKLVSYFAAHDGLSLLQGSCDTFNQRMRAELASACAKMDLGIEVDSFSLERIQPPLTGGTAEAFHKTTSVEQQSKTVIFNAEQKHNRIIPKAETKALVGINNAESYAYEKISSAKAKAIVFGVKYKLYQKYGRLYTMLSYLDKIKLALSESRKIVLAAEANESVLSIDMKAEFNPDMLDMASPESTEK